MLSLSGQNKITKTTSLSLDEILFNVTHETNREFNKLCFVITNFGSLAFQNYLKNLSLQNEHYKTWLQKPDIHLSLRRLKCRGVLTLDQWNLLYASDKQSLIFPPSDLSLLILLLKYTGLINKPEPNGWLNAPLNADQSTGALLVKFQLLRKQIANVFKLDKKIYLSLMEDLSTILKHFGGDVFKEKFESLENEKLTIEDEINAIEYFRIWNKTEEKIYNLEKKLEIARENRQYEIPVLQKPINMRESSSRKDRKPKLSFFTNNYKVNQETDSSKPNSKWSDIKYGIAEEEKEILRKFHSRLISEVRPDSMIDQLLTKKVLNIEESGEIFSSLNSSDQMSFLLDVLVMKTGQAFTEFLNALKSRYFELYLDIYEEYQHMKQEILANKPEGVSYCHTYLSNYYIKIYNQWNPILWYPDSFVNIQTFYCPLQILDVNGCHIEPSEILSHRTQKGPTRTIIVEGDPGTGKSFLSHLLASKWASDPLVFGEDFCIKLVFHLDLKITAPNLKWMLLDQLFTNDLKLTERELWEVIDKHQEICLFILDGYDDNINDEIRQLISGALFPNCHLIIFSNSSSTNSIKEFCQEKLVLTGFMSGEPVNFTKKYIKLTSRPYEVFESLIQKLSKTFSKNKNNKTPDYEEVRTSSSVMSYSQNDQLPVINNTSLIGQNKESPTWMDPEVSFLGRQRAGSVLPGSLMGFSKTLTNKTSKLSPIVNETVDAKEIVEVQQNTSSNDSESNSQERLMALRFYSQFPLYCSFFCVMTDLKLSIDLTSWSSMLEHFFTSIKMKLIERERESRFSVNKNFNTLIESSFESVKQGLSTTFIKESDKLTKFGILKKTSSSNSNFSSKYVFLNDVVQNFLAAKCLDLYGLEEANNYFQNITISKSMYTLIIFYCGIRRNDFETAALRTLFRKIIDLNLQILINDSDTVDYSKSKSRSVNIMNFQLSLDCVAAMNGRNDLALKVGQTLPERLLIQHTCTIPVLTLQGLSFIIDLSCKNIKQLDIRLNYLSRQTPEAFQNLANSIHQNSSIKILRIYWEQLELMSAFFSKVCEKNQSITTIECFDESNHSYDNFTQYVAFNIRNACRNMKIVEGFAFNDCAFPNLTHAIIRNIPENLISLDLSGCSFTIIACKDLAEKINQSKCLKVLKLEKVQIQSMAFNTFIRSFCNNRTVSELYLNGVKMDNVCFFSLAEALKLNNRLEKLCLLDIIINEHNCSELAQVLRVNNTLKEIYLTENKVSIVGQNELHKYEKYTKIIGLKSQISKAPVLGKNRDF